MTPRRGTILDPRVWLSMLLLTGTWSLSTSAVPDTAPAAPPQSAAAKPASDSSGCLYCHAGIEDMHPQASLSCVDCHGGNGQTRQKLEAHVKREVIEAEDERVVEPDLDLAWRRFRNPMDLRVASSACGGCHGDILDHLRLSLHGTTSGHLSDGFYEMGLSPKKGSLYSVFPVAASPSKPGESGEPSEIRALVQVPPFRDTLSRKELAAHFTDLPRKECMQCHLWSEGRAVRGRVGFDGDYRGEGCAACHVAYAIDGLGSSRDAKAVHGEPGHPSRHVMTRAPTTQACTSCHWGDATIGLNFRGLSQLPPGAPGGPEIPGTTDHLLNRQFYLKDMAIDPPDVHHERGLACIDCHTKNDVMGDGKLHGAMEQAVEISCSDCHGTFTHVATLRTQRGTPLSNLRREGDEVILKSKVTGVDHPVVQVVHVIDATRPEYNARAAKAMTAAHGKVECYTCHAGWNANFLGFHFDRNESLTQLDLLTGKRTPGRVTTQEKVFATWKSFYAGLNERGAIAPYLTGFSTMGSVTDKSGARVLDQVMPVTAAGLSGMTMVHHQMHTTRPTARSCVECHRTSTTWGLGSVNFNLARQLAFIADRRGIEIVALHRAQLSSSLPLAKLVLPDVTSLEIQSEPLQGHAHYLYVAEGSRGIHVIDVRDPTTPRRVAFVDTVDPQGLSLRGDDLYCADRTGGLRIYDVSKPEAMHEIGHLPMFDARAVFVQWPWAYVADGSGGLAIADIRAPIAPRLVSCLSFNTPSGPADEVMDVKVMFQYSRPQSKSPEGGAEAPADSRTSARNLCALLDEKRGLLMADVTEPSRPRQIYPDAKRRRSNTAGLPEEALYRGLIVQSHVDLAQAQGGQRTSERDYAYVLVERPSGNGSVSTLHVLDVSDPTRVRHVGQTLAGGATEMIQLGCFYNAPFLQTVLFLPGQDGVLMSDATISAQPNQLGSLLGLRSAYVCAVESFPLDRMLDERGRALKDVSHADSRWLYLTEIERVLSVKPEDLAAPEGSADPPPDPRLTARLQFARTDSDGSGFLEDAEALAAGGSSADEDRDGRLSLAEFATWAGAVKKPIEGTAVAAPASPFRATRVDPDGDLAGLLDGTDPYAFDKDGNSKLDRNEMEHAFFAALDLSRDGHLDAAELSRCPGPLRQIRYGGRRARDLFAAIDQDKDGKIAAKEFQLAGAEWQTLDANGDNFVQLAWKRGSKAYRRGVMELPTEWPARQPFRTLLPPDVTMERVLATFDADGDGKLSRRELKQRPDLFLDMDDDGDGVITAGELKGHCDVVAAGGVELTPETFMERWDLDGSGAVEDRELALPAWVLERIRARGN